MKPTLQVTPTTPPRKLPTLQVTARKLPAFQDTINKVMNPRFIDPQSLAKSNAIRRIKSA